MTRPAGRLSLRLAALTLALAVAGGAAAQDFLDSYKRGLTALDAEDWAAAAEAMRGALAGRSEESGRLTLRFYFKPYLPYYHLGRALFELGECPQALAAWDESERQGVVVRFPEYQELQAKRWTCRQRLESEEAARAAAIQQARGRVERAQQEAALVAALAAEGGEEVWAGRGEGEPSLAERRRQAEELLERARRRLAAAADEGALEVIREAGELAERAAAELAALRVEAARRGEELRARRREQREQLEALAGAARRELDGGAYLEPYPPRTGERRQDLAEALAAAEGLDEAANPAAYEQARAQLAGALTLWRRAAEPPPRVLRAAAGSFFRGAYEDTLERLEGVAPRDPRAAAHAHLLRAASRFALYSLGGEEDPELLATARQDARASRRADPALEPPARYFSPRFRAFFATALADSPPAGGG